VELVRPVAPRIDGPGSAHDAQERQENRADRVQSQVQRLAADSERSYIANQGRAGPHRRLPWTPGFSSLKPSPHLVVIVDVSGSVEDLLLEKFAREIEAITRRQEAGLVLIIGDDEVRRVTRFAPGRSDLREIEFAGGGGTNFTPLLQEADKHRPDIVVVLTDLDGPAQFRPRWPVIWAVPHSHASAVPPFGRKLTLS
jgi:predicted metal-dependent peptidase